MKNTIKSEFENNGDWIEVNDSNLVFEGNVTFEGNADTWTTINLDKSFYYTGKNMLLCVEYHTDNYSGSSPEFYVYSTDDESMRSLSYSSDYYNEAVLWAVKNDITPGPGVGQFSPNASCTRGQIVTFLYRANDQ